MSPDGRAWDVWIGWDPAEEAANLVARRSLEGRSSLPVNVRRIDYRTLEALCIYTRPTDLYPPNRYWDRISNAPMTTGHAIARFFIPYLMNYRGVALFVDGDVLFRSDVALLFAHFDPTKAVQVVQHPPIEVEPLKKGGQLQTGYSRKNWSSVILWNCGHPAHLALTPEVLNSWPGRDLHAFKWLKDELIGALPPSWNYLPGITELANPMAEINLVHYTLGVPTVEGHEGDAFADEWRRWHGATKAVER